VSAALRSTCAVCSLACSLLHALCCCVPWLWSLRLDAGSADAVRLLLSGTLWCVFAVCDAPMIFHLRAAAEQHAGAVAAPMLRCLSCPCACCWACRCRGASSSP